MYMQESYIFLTVVADFLKSYLLGIIYIFLYSLIGALFLLPIFWVSQKVFNWIKQKKDNWIIDSIITSYIVSFFISILVFFFPFLFLGWKFTPFYLLETYSEKGYYILKIIWNLLYVSLIIAMTSQPFVMFFSFLYKKYESKGAFLRIYLSLYFTSVLVLFVNMLFPWIIAGFIQMIIA